MSKTTTHDERGMALIAALMVMLLMSALMIGFTTIVMSDQRFRGIDKDRTRAYYGAQSGLEKLTVDLGNLFLTNVAPTNAQIADLTNHPPSISGISYWGLPGQTAYGVTLLPCDNLGNTSCSATIQNGPYQGLIALKKVYNLDSIAHTTAGGDAHLMRKIESVAIPVFQFGMFSDVDLSFFAGPNFNFGGRVHTNGNLFLAEGPGNTLTLQNKVTAVKDVVRQQMANGVSILTPATHDGIVSMATAPNTFLPLAPTDGSVQQGPGSTPNSNWPTISLTNYNGYIRNGATGARPLNLPLITMGGANTDLVRRPIVAEDVNNPVVFGERMFTKASIRILLSDIASDITNLPTVTATAPVRLSGDWLAAPPAGYGPVDATHPPIARAPGAQSFTGNVPNLNPFNYINIAAGAVPLNVGFHVPNWPLTITYGAGLTMNLDCRTVTSNSFTGCSRDTLGVGGGNGPNAAAGSTFTFIVDGVTYTLTTTNAVAAGNNQTYNFAAGATAPLAENHLWLTDPAHPVPYLVTCAGTSDAAANGGNTTNQLTNCTGTFQNTAVTISSNSLEAANTSLVDGFLKIEMQDTTGAWRDVTMEILNWGFGDRNQAGTPCADPTPNAIIRFQRLRDNNGSCGYAGSRDSYDYWPNTLFDAREGLQRDVDPGNKNATMGGVMDFVSLDVGNLAKWLKGTAPYGGGSGNQAYTNNGYGVYFSDRRNNRNALSQETGEYGFEDVVNPVSALGVPDGILNGGEDVNANGVLDVYGQFPSWNGIANSLPGPAGFSAPFNSVATMGPTRTLPYPQGMVNRTYLFRRALKMVNGSLGNIPTPGLMVISENPVYVQGDWNANQAGYGASQAASCVIGDAVTLLSNAWTDANSFANPYQSVNRTRSAQSWYRLGIIAGKGMAFPLPASGNTASDFGTDGGAHNFLRMLEGNGGTVNYQGAIATFYFSRQAVGTYKNGVNNVVYSPPTRNFQFDQTFLNPATLCPLTPMFRDINALGFTQEIRPGK